MSVWSALVFAALSLGCLLAGRTLFHFFQLESYQFPGYFRTLKRNPVKSLLPGFLLNIGWAACSAGVSLLFPERGIPQAVTEALLLLSCACAVRLLTGSKHEKKAMRFTARMKRLYTVCGILFFFILVLLEKTGDRGLLSVTLPYPTACMLFPLLLPLWVALGGLLAWPIEKLISEMYFRDAQHMLDSRKDLIKIGITGSWGKTSVKFILGTMLEEKYHTLVTPSSFNTPMGVTRVIRSALEPGHRVFIAEMGARHVGDIREMCRLVHPSIGLLTSVGPQHLDTFRTIDRVRKTKYELIEALPADGFACFADDGDIVRQMHAVTNGEKYLTGLDPSADDIWAEEISVTPQGSRFLLCDGKSRLRCETVLLGELNIRNILLCAAVCRRLGLSDEQIVRGIQKLKPVEHRLQLIHHEGGLTVIDDAFNSNIRGAQQAFQILKRFPGRRITVTPGMVELGTKEEEMNRKLGEMLADCCDTAVLVGPKRSIPIAEGLKEKGFPENQIYVTASLEEAAEWLKREAKPGDTVLFENDLPDHYSEK